MTQRSRTTLRKYRFIFSLSRVMANVEEKCDLAYSLIEKCKKNDTALVEEKPNIFKLIEEVSSFIQKCELESVETDSLTCYFEYKLFDMLKTQIGGVRVLKPGKKGLFP